MSEKIIVEPLFDQILILPEDKKKETITGIIIPESANEAPSIAKVISVGEGKLGSNGNLIPMKVKAGDRILYKTWGTNSIKLDGKEHLLLKQEDVLALVKN